MTIEEPIVANFRRCYLTTSKKITRFGHQHARRKRRSPPATGGLDTILKEGISSTRTQIQVPVLQQSLQQK